MTLNAGYDGKGKMGQWLPVDVELVNNGPDLQGELVYDLAPVQQPASQLTRYQTPVSLPSGQKKHYRVYVLASQGPQGFSVPTLRLMSGDKEIASDTPSVQFSPDVLVGVLGPENEAVGALNTADFPVNNRHIHLVHLDPAALSDQAQALGSLDVILVDNFASAELTQQQRKAIQEWTESGGLLVIGGGPEAKKTLEAFKDWLPFTLEDTAAIGGQKLADFVGAQAPGGQIPVSRISVKGGNVLAEDGGLPLVTELKKGSGRVAVLAFDPSLEPISGWRPGAGLFFRNLLLRELAPDRINNWTMQQQPWLWTNLLNTIANLPITDLPSIRWFMGLTIAYILLLGPINFIVLRRLRKAHLAWLTIPALVLVFASTTWFIARRNGHDMLTTAISVVQYQPGSNLAEVRSLVGVYTPAETKTKLHVDGESLIQVIPSYNNWGPPPNTGPLPVGASVALGSGDVVLQEVPLYSLRGVSTQGYLTAKSGFEGSLHYDDKNHLVGRITNQTGIKLSGVAVVTATGYQTLPDLDPGASTDVDFSISGINGGGPQFGGPSPLINSLNRLYQVQGGWGPNMTADLREQMRRQQIVNMIFQGIVTANEPVYVLGWSNQNMVHLTLDNRDPTAYATTLVMQPLSTTAGPGPFDAPPGAVMGRLVDWQGTGGMMGGGPGMMPLPQDGDVTVEFKLPLIGGAAVDSLSLRMPMFPMGKGLPNGNMGEALGVSFRDAKTGEWAKVDMKTDTANVDDAARFVDGAGRVQVKLHKLTRDMFGIGTPTLGFAGKGGHA